MDTYDQMLDQFLESIGHSDSYRRLTHIYRRHVTETTGREPRFPVDFFTDMDAWLETQGCKVVRLKGSGFGPKTIRWRSEQAKTEFQLRWG